MVKFAKWNISERQKCGIQVHIALTSRICTDLRFQMGVRKSANPLKFRHFYEYDDN